MHVWYSLLWILPDRGSSSVHMMFKAMRLNEIKEDSSFDGEGSNSWAQTGHYKICYKLRWGDTSKEKQEVAASVAGVKPGHGALWKSSQENDSRWIKWSRLSNITDRSSMTEFRQTNSCHWWDCFCALLGTKTCFD